MHSYNPRAVNSNKSGGRTYSLITVVISDSQKGTRHSKQPFKPSGNYMD